MTASLRVVPRNFHYEATLSTEFASTDGCSIVNTQNRHRSRFWRAGSSTSADPTDDQFIAGTFDDTIEREPDYFAFFRHRCHGGDVRLQLYSDAAFTSQVYDSGAQAVITAIGTDGANWGIDPYGVGPYDPFITRSPYYLRFDPVGCLSYKVSFTNFDTTFGSEAWEVGTFWLGRSFAPERQPAFGADLGRIDLTDVDRSRGGSLYTNVGEQARTLRLALEAINEDERAAWLDIAERCGLGRDVLISMFDGEGTRRERDHVLDGTFSALNAIGRQVNRLTHTLQFQES
jgi:hypothetical protein